MLHTPQLRGKEGRELSVTVGGTHVSFALDSINANVDGKLGLVSLTGLSAHLAKATGASGQGIAYGSL